MVILPLRAKFLASLVVHFGLIMTVWATHQNKPVLPPTQYSPPLAPVYTVVQPQPRGNIVPQPVDPRYQGNPESKVIQGLGQVRTCYKVPLNVAFNISDNSYYFPVNNVNQELTERADVLEQIFKEGMQITAPDPNSEQSILYNAKPSDYQSSVGDALQKDSNDDYEGCAGYRLLLRSFDAFGGHCWVVYPRHQAVSYMKCSAPKCGDYTSRGACSVDEVSVGVWAWCETLPLGKRVSKVYLPLPISCKCQRYDC